MTKCWGHNDRDNDSLLQHVCVCVRVCVCTCVRMREDG